MLPPIVTTACAVVAAYLLGCFSTGYYLVSWRTRADVRAQGSGSTGARNAGRVLGGGGFALVLLGDAAKGAAAVGLAGALGAGRPGMLVAALAVVAGHLFPAQLGFRGGKGAAMLLGALLVLDPWTAAGGLGIAALAAAALRRTVAGSLVAYVLLPAVPLVLHRPAPEVFGVAGLAALVLVGHREHLAAAVRGARAWSTAGGAR
ncbi:MAG TPA: glycerol-3-phosphate acyltransferase [Longimicrobiaceae bacterium]|nr:glycerol-3-phosphate acyltransferase [Longimicrobiaceae bacterium]